MKLNHYHKLDLTKSTVIEIFHPKKRVKRRPDDNYDFSDKLIEHMEGEDELVPLESHIENFFVYQGTLEESREAVLERYEKRLKRTDKMKIGVQKEQNQHFSENFSLKLINHYNETKEQLRDKIEKNNCKTFKLYSHQNLTEDVLKIAKNSELVEELVILESCFTTKKFDDITADLILKNGPLLERSDLETIIQHNKEQIDSEQTKISETLNNKINSKERNGVGNLILTKEFINSVCELINRKIKVHFLMAMDNQVPRETHRKIKKDLIKKTLYNLNEQDFDDLKKKMVKIDLFKQFKSK